MAQTKAEVVKAAVHDIKQTPKEEAPPAEAKQPNLPDVTLVGEPKEEKEEVSKTGCNKTT